MDTNIMEHAENRYYDDRVLRGMCGYHDGQATPRPRCSLESPPWRAMEHGVVRKQLTGETSAMPVTCLQHAGHMASTYRPHVDRTSVT